MKRAIISDIHGNLEALTAVLEDIKNQNVDEVFCLGDVVGYGPNPLECLDLVMKECKLCLIGNHEQGVIYDPDCFNNTALRAIFWTREQICAPSERRDERWEFINMNPRKWYDENWKAIFVHGSPMNALNEYVFPDDIYNPPKLDRLFNLVTHVSFQGHTHMPGIFTENYDFIVPETFNYKIDLDPKQKYLVNVGSVGQPRDSNPKSCYLTVEDHNGILHLEYRRIEYPVQETIHKIFQVSELDHYLGERLSQGR